MADVGRQHWLMKDLKAVLLETHTESVSESDHDEGLLGSSCRTVLVDPALQLPVAFIRTQEVSATRYSRSS